MDTSPSSAAPNESLLEVLSPALNSLISRTFKPGDIPIVEQFFEYGWKNGGDSELDIYRAEGVSFNPRIARIAQLGIIEGNIRDIEILSALFLSVPPQSSFTIPSIASPRVTHITRQARALIAGDSSAEVGPEGVIAAACILDRIRHLHIASKQPEHRLQELHKLEQIVSPLMSLPHVNPFKDKITSAIKRYHLAKNARYTPLSSSSQASSSRESVPK